MDAIVKAQSPRGTFEMQNVHFGPQPASLFAVPAGYTTKNMGPTVHQSAPPGSPNQQPAPPAPPKKNG
jgi:hypothetical protein